VLLWSEYVPATGRPAATGARVDTSSVRQHSVLQGGAAERSSTRLPGNRTPRPGAAGTTVVVSAKYASHSHDHFVGMARLHRVLTGLECCGTLVTTLVGDQTVVTAPLEVRACREK